MYYFAYGSNLNLDHMRRICGWHFHVLGVAELSGYELGGDGRGFANIRPQSGKQVVGVLYDVDQHSLDALDEYEGYPNVFNRVEVQVKDDSGETYTAWVYLEKAELFGGDFWQEEYLKRVVSGAVENHLPQEWIDFLYSFHKPAHG